MWATAFGAAVLALSSIACESDSPPVSKTASYRPSTYRTPSATRTAVLAAHARVRDAVASLDPGTATARGDHRFDAELRPPTRERVAESVEILDRVLDDLDEVRYGPMDPQVDADYAVVRARAEMARLDLGTLKIVERNASWSVGVALRSVVSLMESPDLDDVARQKALVARLKAMPEFFEESRRVIKFARRVDTEIAIDAI